MAGHFLIDCDGTLAMYGGYGPKIGPPVQAMLDQVNDWLDQGFEVKIFTARAIDPDEVKKVKAWLKEQGLPDLDVVNYKSFDTIEIWDDRAVQIEFNTGRVIGQSGRQFQDSKKKWEEVNKEGLK